MIVTTRIGLPLLGASVEERVVTSVPQTPGRWFARSLSGLRFQSSRALAPWPRPISYGNTLNANRVTRLHNIRWGHGVADIVRHDHASFSELLAGSWTLRNPAAGFGGSTSVDYWGGALVPSTSGKGFYMFSNRVVGPFYWDGTAANAVNPPVGTNPCRFVVAFADRTMLFNLLTTASVTYRSCQWSLPGDGITFTGVGSGDRDFTEFEGEITGVAAIRRQLTVYHRFGIVTGGETFNPDSPVSYSPEVTNGVGNIAPAGLLSYNDVHAFLSEEGFRSWDGSQLQPIGAPIDRYILDNVNRRALHAVCGFVKEDWQTAVWALPMGSSSVPTELWAYDFKRNAWHSLPLSPYFSVAPTAFAVVTQSEALQLNDAFFAGKTLADATLTGKRLLDFAGAGFTPTIISGHDNGTTNTLDERQTASPITIQIDTPSLTWEGFLRGERGQAVNISPKDFVTVDELVIYYTTISGTATLYTLVSNNGGQSFTPLGADSGTLSLPARVGDSIGKARQTGRVSGFNPIIRLTNVHPITGVVAAFSAKIEDISVSINTTGEVREAAL